MNDINQLAPLYGSPTLLKCLPKIIVVGDCWVWQGQRTPGGYGMIQVGESRRTLSRVILQEMLSPLPPHIFACHECDNPPCVNPEHLFAGTQTDNLLDCVSKGRQPSKKKTHCKYGHEYTPENTYISGRRRNCKTCHYALVKRARAKQKSADTKGTSA